MLAAGGTLGDTDDDQVYVKKFLMSPKPEGTLRGKNRTPGNPTSALSIYTDYLVRPSGFVLSLVPTTNHKLQEVADFF